MACPCHLPLTLPLLLSLTAGTALGVFLQQHPWVVFGASTVLFVTGVYLALQWMGQEGCRVDSRMREPLRAPH